MLTRGSQVQAKLIEVIEKNRWIVSFQGELLQVHNSTDIKFEAGKKVLLLVCETSPLVLKVVRDKSSNRIDRFI